MKESKVGSFEAMQLGDGTAAWRIAESEYLAQCPIFNLRKDISINPRGGGRHDFFVIEAPDWINVIPITRDGDVVMIEQYRHGTQEVTLEIPGGMVDDGEEPRAAAARELFEETGYRAESILPFGATRPNPAIMNNSLHSFLAQNCSFHEAPRFEGSEHTVVRLVKKSDIPTLIANGVISHALVIVAFHKFSLL